METQGCKQCQQKSPSSAPDEEFCWLQRHRSSRHDWPHTRAERGWKKTQPTKQVPGCLSFPCSLWFTKEHSTQIWEGMFFQRQSGMWSVRHADRLTDLAGQASKAFSPSDICRVLPALLPWAVSPHSVLCTPVPCWSGYCWSPKAQLIPRLSAKPDLTLIHHPFSIL